MNEDKHNAHGVCVQMKMRMYFNRWFSGKTKCLWPETLKLWEFLQVMDLSCPPPAHNGINSLGVWDRVGLVHWLLTLDPLQCLPKISNADSTAGTLNGRKRTIFTCANGSLGFPPFPLTNLFKAKNIFS